MTYNKLVEKLSKHFKRAPSAIIERFKFHSWNRKPGESAATFIAELRLLAEFCNFGKTLDVMLHDHNVCGSNELVIRKQLLAQLMLDYSQVIEKVLNLEATARSLQELKGKEDTQSHDVHKTESHQVQAQGGEGISGPMCGNQWHTVAKCQINHNVVCHNCEKNGHMQDKTSDGTKQPIAHASIEPNAIGERRFLA